MIKPERKSVSDLRNLIYGIYTFCWKFSKRASVPGESAAGAKYPSLRIHPKSYITHLSSKS